MLWSKLVPVAQFVNPENVRIRIKAVGKENAESINEEVKKVQALVAGLDPKNVYIDSNTETFEGEEIACLKAKCADILINGSLTQQLVVRRGFWWWTQK